MSHAAVSAVERIVAALHDAGVIFVPKGTLLEATGAKAWCDTVRRFLFSKLEDAGIQPHEVSLANDHSFVLIVLNSKFRTGDKWRWLSTPKRLFMPLVESARRMSQIANPPKRAKRNSRSLH